MIHKNRLVLKGGRAEKVNYRDEFPLRGLLQCPKCHSSWTGSGSKEMVVHTSITIAKMAAKSELKQKKLI